MRTPRTPSYRLHRPSGQAVVSFPGQKDRYLGRYGTPESQAEYDRLIAEWLAGGRGKAAPKPSKTDATVAECMAAYWRYCEAHYSAPTTLDNIKKALGPVKELYAHTPAVEFGPKALKTVRAKMVADRLARTTVNARIRKIKAAFAWCVEEELLPGSVHHALQAVKGLRRGKDGVEESDPVRPVPDEHVTATMEHLHEPVRSMVGIQRLTGMRPGEIVIMRTGDVDRSGAVWIYTPRQHKTQNAGRTRSVPIGPKAQALLRPWLKADPDAFVFSPQDAVALKVERRRAARKTPLTPSQRARKPKRKPKHPARERYGRDGYLQAIHRGCDKARVPHWTPNQLRHSCATEIRRRFGLEAAQVVLGHAQASVTQVYAERDLAAAVEVMKAIG